MHMWTSEQPCQRRCTKWPSLLEKVAWAVFLAERCKYVNSYQQENIKTYVLGKESTQRSGDLACPGWLCWGVFWSRQQWGSSAHLAHTSPTAATCHTALWYGRRCQPRRKMWRIGRYMTTPTRASNLVTIAFLSFLLAGSPCLSLTPSFSGLFPDVSVILKQQQKQNSPASFSYPLDVCNPRTEWLSDKLVCFHGSKISRGHGRHMA